MGDAIGIVFEQLEKMLPERFRVRIVACLALIGLAGWMYVSVHIFARSDDLKQLRNDMTQQVANAVQPVTEKLQQTQRITNSRYLDQLDSEILQAAARCGESKNDESRGLYRSELSQLLRRYQDIAGTTYPQQVECK